MSLEKKMFMQPNQPNSRGINSEIGWGNKEPLNLISNQCQNFDVPQIEAL